MNILECACCNRRGYGRKALCVSSLLVYFARFPIYTCPRAHIAAVISRSERQILTPALGWQVYSTFFKQLSQVEEAEIEDDDQRENINAGEPSPFKVPF